MRVGWIVDSQEATWPAPRTLPASGRLSCTAVKACRDWAPQTQLPKVRVLFPPAGIHLAASMSQRLPIGATFLEAVDQNAFNGLAGCDRSQVFRHREKGREVQGVRWRVLEQFALTGLVSVRDVCLDVFLGPTPDRVDAPGALFGTDHARDEIGEYAVAEAVGGATAGVLLVLAPQTPTSSLSTQPSPLRR